MESIDFAKQQQKHTKKRSKKKRIQMFFKALLPYKSHMHDLILNMNV